MATNHSFTTSCCSSDPVAQQVWLELVEKVEIGIEKLVNLLLLFIVCFEAATRSLMRYCYHNGLFLSACLIMDAM